MTQPFQPEGLSTFNSFTTGELRNAFVSGFIVLLILTELTNIANAFLYRSHNLEKSSIDRCIIFSRITRISGLISLFRGVEHSREKLPCSTIYETEPNMDTTPNLLSEHEYGTTSPPKVNLKYSKLIVPVATFMTLMLAEMLAIYLGTSQSQQVLIRSGFDPRLQLPIIISHPQVSSECSNHIKSTRGAEKVGEVLKCVRQSRARHFQTKRNTQVTISCTFKRAINLYMFEINTEAASTTRVGVEVLINLVDGETLRTAPLRPDLDELHSRNVFAAVMKHALESEGDAISSNIKVERFREGEVRMSISQIVSNSSRIGSSVAEALRGLQLTSNGSGLPWVFENGGYARRNGAVIALVGINPVAHGVLLLVGVGLLALRLVAHRFWIPFDEAAYVATRMTLGADMSLGVTARQKDVGRLQLRKFVNERDVHVGFRGVLEHGRMTRRESDEMN